MIFFYVSYRAKKILDKKLKKAEKKIEKNKELEAGVWLTLIFSYQ